MKESISLDFTLTLVCNNNCLFCPRAALKPITTTPALALAAIKKAGGCREAVLTGGEPTLLRDLAATAAACKAAGAKKIAIVTNGRALSDPRYLEKLVSAGITGFTISLYSHLPGAHDRLTRAGGSCAQTWQGLRNAVALSRAGLIDLGVNMVLCAENIRTAGTTLKLLRALGADSVTLINLAGPAAAGHIFSYSKVKALRLALTRERAAFPARVLWRGFPLCVLPDGTVAENQDIGGAGGVPRARLAGYEKAFKAQFVKPLSLCRGCNKARRCNGIPAAYFKRYDLAGVRA